MRTSLMRRRTVAAAVLLIATGCAARPQPVAGPPSQPGTTASSGAASSTPAGSPSRPPGRTTSGETTPTSAPTPPSSPTSPAGSPPARPPFDPRLAGTDWERIPTSARVVALTFDAGANADAVASILGTLRSTGVPATFFLTGRFVDGYGPASRAIAAGGYRLGDHSIDHPYFTRLSNAEIRRQVLTAAARIRAVTSRDPTPLFRFPYGDRDTRTIAAANAAGYVPVRWTVDTLGWKGTSGGQSTATVLARVLAGLRPGEIVLMHVGSHPTDRSTLDAAALASVISTVRARGYRFVTLDALL
jgi:peptidoglycan/xylan/chitin deacetylase (PgdA/CDA1 family)